METPLKTHFKDHVVTHLKTEVTCQPSELLKESALKQFVFLQSNAGFKAQDEAEVGRGGKGEAGRLNCSPT